MNTRNFIILLCFSFLMFYCKNSSTESETNETETKPFLNTLWVLESFDISGEIIKPTEDQMYNIKFKNDSTFSGQSDCNDIGGRYIIEQKGVINITKLGTTFASCGDQSKDEEYYGAIDQIFSYEVIKNHLRLKYGEDSILTFISK